jgi:uncharacterized protein (TIGR02145 family)
MKSTGTTYWNIPNTSATNESSFSALPGGSRYTVYSFYEVRNYAFFWSATATEDENILAWYRILFSNNGSVFRNNGYPKPAGASVRCLRD